jgi:hypothetical protein
MFISLNGNEIHSGTLHQSQIKTRTLFQNTSISATRYINLIRFYSRWSSCTSKSIPIYSTKIKIDVPTYCGSAKYRYSRCFDFERLVQHANRHKYIYTMTRYKICRSQTIHISAIAIRKYHLFND